MISRNNLHLRKVVTFLGKGGVCMTRSQHEKERTWQVRKQNQKPHGKIKSLKELENEGTKS